MTAFGDVASNTSLLRSIHLDISNFRQGATAPTEVTIGTTPTLQALRFAATNELVSVFASFPHDMDTTQDLTLHLQWVLVSAQTDSDTLDITCDYVAVTPFSTGNGPGKTSSQTTGQITATTANGLAAGDLYEMDIVFSAGDATNPLSGTHGIGLEFHLTNTTGVASADLIDVDILYTALY